MENYRKPFALRDGRIVDATGKEVRLWGVNYYAPFNHNYANMAEMGIDHLAAVDRDLLDFGRLGVQIVRMHLYEREITDVDGNLVDNDHLRVFDYLVERMHAKGIYFMLTPTVWWSTVETEITAAKNYAYWGIDKMNAFGFSNFYPKHAMVWHEGAISCQERYLSQLFDRRNRFSGKKLAEYDNLVVVEAINEPTYPSPEIIRGLEKNKEALARNPIGREEIKLLGLYADFLSARGLADTDDNADTFCVALVAKYIRRIFAKVDEYFGNTVIKTHIHYGYKNPKIHACLAEAPIDSICVSAYIPCNFESRHNDLRNIFKEVRELRADYELLLDIPKGLIAYEFNSVSNLDGYPLGAIAFMMASMGVQIATNFTYTPADVAAWNPGWLVHYLSLEHTPVRSAAFTAAGEIFRSTQRGTPIPESDTLWSGKNFTIDVKRDRVAWWDETKILHAGDFELVSPDGGPKPGAAARSDHPPKKIIGRGNSPYILHEGNGLYYLDCISGDELRLVVMPDQWYVNDPFRGRVFRGMANRYINANHEPIVSRLKEKGSSMRILYPGFESAAVEYKLPDRWVPIAAADGNFRADPGEYRIIKQAAPTIGHGAGKAAGSKGAEPRCSAENELPHAALSAASMPDGSGPRARAGYGEPIGP